MLTEKQIAKTLSDVFEGVQQIVKWIENDQQLEYAVMFSFSNVFHIQFTKATLLKIDHYNSKYNGRKRPEFETLFQGYVTDVETLKSILTSIYIH